MNNANRIAKYVREVMDLYNANDYGFFRDYDEETNAVIECPLFTGDDTIDNETIERLSVYLGLSKDEILQMDKEAARRYYEKYPFFRLFDKYLTVWNWYSEFKSERPTAEDYLLHAIFGNIAKIKTEKRYDYDSVKQRMIDQLKQIDQVVPGTYHVNAQIKDLKIDTEVFFSFPECGKMIDSFLDMVDRLKKLFYKVLESDLSEDEIHEMNFLASWLDAKDRIAVSYTLTYSTVRKLKDVYLNENLRDFFCYAKIKNFFSAGPWRCKEFFDDDARVEKFVGVFPQTKSEIREFALAVSKFTCVFTWSDAKPITFSKEEEELDKAMWEGTEFYVPVEKRAKERTRLYVNKTSDELFDWEPYVKRIQKAASPEKMGGIKLPAYCNATSQFELSRMSNRIEALHGGNQ